MKNYAITKETHAQIRTLKELKDPSVFILKKLTGMGYSEVVRRKFEHDWWPLSLSDQLALDKVREMNRLAYELPQIFETKRAYIRNMFKEINHGLPPVYAISAFDGVVLPKITVELPHDSVVARMLNDGQGGSYTGTIDLDMMIFLMYIKIYNRFIGEGMEAVAKHMTAENLLKFFRDNEEELLQDYREHVQSNLNFPDVVPCRYNIRWRRCETWPDSLFVRKLIEYIISIREICGIETHRIIDQDLENLRSIVRAYKEYKQKKNPSKEEKEAIRNLMVDYMPLSHLRVGKTIERVQEQLDKKNS